MTRSRTHWFWFLLWLSCVCFTLSPLEPVVRAVDVATAPLRYLAELASPLALLRHPSVVAAEARLGARIETEVAENQALLEALAQHALPRDPRLTLGRRLVHAEVVGREGGELDRLSLSLRDMRGVRVGLPVACGDAYVGRVVELTPNRTGHGGRAVCELVTERAHRVGGRLEHSSPEVFMTVGGVLALRRFTGDHDVRLRVHQPSDREVSAGTVLVQEHFPEAEEYAALFDNLRLGQLMSDGPEGPWWIVPELDYIDGLYQVVILAPLDPDLPPSTPFDHALEDGRWVAAKALSLGEPSSWRAAIKVSAGRRDEVVAGAAVTGIGPRLFGRVTRAGYNSSNVSFLEDPGFNVVAVGLFPDDERPRILGRLISRGRDPYDGTIRFRWIVRVALAGLRADALLPQGAVARARLFTGSGESGLPAGLLLGDALIPLDARPGEVREIRLEFDVDPHHLRRFHVRRSDLREGGAE